MPYSDSENIAWSCWEPLTWVYWIKLLFYITSKPQVVENSMTGFHRQSMEKKAYLQYAGTEENEFSSAGM